MKKKPGNIIGIGIGNIIGNGNGNYIGNKPGNGIDSIIGHGNGNGIDNEIWGNILSTDILASNSSLHEIIQDELS